VLTRVHLLVDGRVQGVCYRMATEERAIILGLTGWVRNLRDGRVEVVAEGEHSNVMRLVEWCRSGPPMAMVTNLTEDYQDPTGGFSTFSTKHTV
jgi:acylphosphatase